MGIFKGGAIGAIVNPVASATLGVAESIFGGGKDAPQFNPDTRDIRADIAKIRELRDSPIEGVRESGELQLKLLEQQKGTDLDALAAAGAQGLETSQQQLALTGGLGAGANERLARLQNQNVLKEQQKARGLFSRQATQIRAEDIAQQEGLRNQALFSLPELSAIPLGIQTSAAAANMRAKAVQDAANKQRMAGIGSLLGAGAGFAFGGGPVGAAVGSSIGGGIFSSF